MEAPRSFLDDGSHNPHPHFYFHVKKKTPLSDRIPLTRQRFVRIVFLSLLLIRIPVNGGKKTALLFGQVHAYIIYSRVENMYDGRGPPLLR